MYLSRPCYQQQGLLSIRVFHWPWHRRVLLTREELHGYGL
ncbi:hypothetical protein BH23GEM6_BH23GEM6_24180 [soil metagenome]